MYARLLSRDDMGVLVMAGAICGLLGPVLSLGLPTGFLVQVAGLTDRERIARAYGTVVAVVGAAAVTGTLAFQLALAGAGGAPWTAALRANALAIGVWLGVSAMRDTALAPAQLRQETGFLAAWNLSTEYGGALLAILLLIVGFGVQGVLWGAAGALAVGVAAALVRSLAALGARAEGPDHLFLKAALAAGLPMLCVTAGEWSVLTADRFVLAHTHGEAEVGSYGIAHAAASATLLVAATVNLVFFPAALHLWHREADRLDRFLAECLRLVGTLLGLFVVGACLLARWGMTLLAGPAYLDAAAVLPLLVLGYCAATLIQLLRFVPMVVERRTADVAGCYLAIAVLDVVLCLVLVPRHAMKGAALAGLLAQAVGLVLVGTVARRSLPPLRWWRPLAGPLAATALVAPVALFFFSVPPGAAVGRAIAPAASLIAAYVVVAYLVGALNAGDWKRLRGLMAERATPGRKV